ARHTPVTLTRDAADQRQLIADPLHQPSPRRRAALRRMRTLTQYSQYSAAIRQSAQADGPRTTPDGAILSTCARQTLIRNRYKRAMIGGGSFGEGFASALCRLAGALEGGGGLLQLVLDFGDPAHVLTALLPRLPNEPQISQRRLGLPWGAYHRKRGGGRACGFVNVAGEHRKLEKCGVVPIVAALVGAL